MISVSLPPVFFGGNISLGEVYEAFACTYWARYSTLPISARVLQSMQRAWGIVDATMYPRAGAIPGMVGVRVGTGAQYRVVIGIEGANNVGQLLSSPNALSAQTITGCQGRVASYIKDSYLGCLAAIPALTPMASALLNPRVPVTFTGHSLGGAIAEVWANALKNAVPGKTVRYIAFGAPRVGTKAWMEGKHPGVKFVHLYSEFDQIHRIPQDNTFSLQSLGPGGLLLQRAAYVRENSAQTVNRHGQVSLSLPENFFTHPSIAVVMNGMPVAPTPGSYWWNHQANVYRTFLMSRAIHSGDEIPYRFNHLEWENENQWQVLHRMGADYDPAWNNLILPGPAEVEPYSQRLRDLAGLAPPAVQPPGVADPAVIGDTVAPDGSGGGEWGEQPLVVTQALPQRARRAMP
ncbi:MAG: hypothetical protein JOZ10_16170 [Acidobacteria bacterium]|nr:hypothetical protein [Acidobacteriota bacterium]